MITLTAKAVEKLKEIADSEDIKNPIVRVKIKGGGCAGMEHDFYFDDKILDSDEITKIDGIQIIVDPISYQYVENVTINFVETIISNGFKFSSPDIKSTCGCGKSFSY